MTDMRLVQLICRNCCSFYKPSKDEELACRGFLIAEQMVEARKELLFACNGLTGKAMEHRTDPDGKSLIENMCPVCSFFEKDCDFSEKKKDSPPCGGFIFIQLLMKAGLLGIDDISHIK